MILLSASTNIQELQTKIAGIIPKSPNCAEALAKYSKSKGDWKVNEIKVRWSGEPREARLWPSSTILTEENVEAVLQLVALHGGKDVMMVEASQPPPPEEKKEEKKEEE